MSRRAAEGALAGLAGEIVEPIAPGGTGKTAPSEQENGWCA